MVFRPGQSGNPSGRPKVVGEVRDLARQHCPEAIQTLVTIMSSAKAQDGARVAAAKEILDRGYGKVTQPISGDDGAPALQVLVRRLVEVQTVGS